MEAVRGLCRLVGEQIHRKLRQRHEQGKRRQERQERECREHRNEAAQLGTRECHIGNLHGIGEQRLGDPRNVAADTLVTVEQLAFGAVVEARHDHLGSHQEPGDSKSGHERPRAAIAPNDHRVDAECRNQ